MAPEIRLTTERNVIIVVVVGVGVFGRIDSASSTSSSSSRHLELTERSVRIGVADSLLSEPNLDYTMEMNALNGREAGK